MKQQETTNWDKYIIEWHTRPGIGATYYDGKTTVWAEDDEDARNRAQREIHRTFGEYPLSHIVITSVSRQS